MRRKLLSWLLVMAMTLLFLPGQARAETGSIEDKANEEPTKGVKVIVVDDSGDEVNDVPAGTRLTAKVVDSDNNEISAGVTYQWNYFVEDDEEGLLPITGETSKYYQTRDDDAGNWLQVEVEVTVAGYTDKQLSSSVYITEPGTEVKLDQDNLAMTVGNTAVLRATVTPENATNGGEAAWTSSDKTIATVAAVDSTGTVTAVGVGTAIITVIVGEVFASCEVTVSAPPVTGINLEKALILKKGGTAELTATVVPENAVAGDFTWASSNPAVAVVEGNGGAATVTANAAGKATITAAAGSVSASCEVTVPGVAITAGRTAVTAGETLELTAETVPADLAGVTYAWTSSDTAIATVAAKDGEPGRAAVQGVAAGSSTITVTVLSGERELAAAAFAVTVEPAPVKAAAARTEGAGIIKDLSEAVDGKFTGIAAVILENAVFTGAAEAAGGTGIGSLFEVTGGAAGVTITGVTYRKAAGAADADGYTIAFLTLSVDSGAAPLETAVGIAVKKAALAEGAVIEGETLKAVGEIRVKITGTVRGVAITGAGVAAGTAKAGTELTAAVVPGSATVEYQWTRGGEVVSRTAAYTPAEGDAGRTVTVTVTGTGGYTGSAAASVTVMSAVVAVESVTLSESELTLTVGGSGGAGAQRALTATVAPADATKKEITWATSDANVATVAGGVVTATGAGTATITASAGGKSAACTVTVTAGSDGEEDPAPGTDTPGTDTPGTDTPGTDTPGTDTPGTDTPGTDTPGTDTPGTDTPGTDTPGTDTPGTDTPGTDTPGTDTPGTDTPGTDTPGTGESGTSAEHPDKISVIAPDKVVAKEEDGSVKVDMTTDAEAEEELRDAIQSAIDIPDTTGVELTVASDADDIKVELNKGVYDQIAKADTEVSLTVKTEKVEVTLPKTAIGKVSGGLDGEDSAVLQVTDITHKVDSSKPAYIPDKALTIALDVTMLKGSGEKINIDNLEKPIELLFNIGGNLAEEKITVFYIPVAGDWEEVDDASYNSKTGALTVNVRHLSQFAVTVNDEPIEPPATPSVPSTPSTPSAPSAPSTPSVPGYVPDYTPVYQISVGSGIGGGTVSVNPKSASGGSVVTVTVKPESGYKLEALRVTKSLNKDVPLSDKGDGTYTFVMPASGVTVSAAFKQVAAEPPAALPGSVTPTYSFTDVAVGEYYYNAVQWAIRQNVTTGVGGNRFAPHDACTRGEIVTFLWRAAGSPKNFGTSAFTDVQPGDYYYDAVGWAVSRGITTGMGDNKFAPHDVCTRAQAVTFLYRFVGSPSAGGSSAFTDVAGDAYYANAVNWAVANHITNGTTATTFGPMDNCTRGHIVTFLYRTLIR